MAKNQARWQASKKQMKISLGSSDAVHMSSREFQDEEEERWRGSQTVCVEFIRNPLLDEPVRRCSVAGNGGWVGGWGLFW